MRICFLLLVGKLWLEQNASGVAAGATEGSAWVFDDVVGPASLGHTLSADMVHSRNGYTLVQVGDAGLLLSPAATGSPPQAVRRVASAKAATLHVPNGATRGGAQHELQLGTLPCPENADLQSCQVWCDGLSRGPHAPLRGTLGGSLCPNGKSAKSTDRPSCMCYDADYTDLEAMCLSPCRTEIEEAPTALQSGTCAVGESCDSSATTKEKSLIMDTTRRYFLYDTKYGEGFNLQREVYPRAGWVVAELNKAVEKRCGGDVTSRGCLRWILVLPPWCRVAHWWSGPEHVKWNAFFDATALASSKVPVIEFEEYTAAVGGPFVDLAVAYATEALPEKVRKTLKGGADDFVGWTEDVQACDKRYARGLRTEPDEASGLQRLDYAGLCQGGILTRELRCGALNGPWPNGIVDLVKTLDESEDNSVLVKGYDYLLAPDHEELDALGLRESMLFSKEIRAAGETYIEGAFGGKPYLAAHCRRTDFLKVRAETTPSADAIAFKLSAALAERGLDKVFVATDAPDDLREELQRKVRGGTVHFFDSAASAATFDHPGKQAAAEIWVAARADFFIGTVESRFTMWIQMERGFLGKAKETSEQEFCTKYAEGDHKCLAPKYRHPGRAGAHRDAYFG